MDTVIIIGPIAPYRGGIAAHTDCIAAALAAGYEVSVISFKRQYPVWLYPGTSDRLAEIPPDSDHQFQLDLLNPYTWWAVSTQLIARQPSAVLIPWWTTVWAIPIGLISQRLYSNRIPVISLIHNVFPHEATRWDRALTRFGLRTTQRFIVQARSQQQQLNQLRPNAETVYCPHPAYPKLAEQAVERNASVPQFLFFGLVRDYKGLTDLLQALPSVIEQGYAFTLNIIGEFWTDIATYEALISTLRLTDYVIIRNEFVSTDAAHAAFETADLVIAPYRQGTQSGVMALAQSYGTAIVASSTIQDSVSPDYVGWQRFVAPQQPAEITAALLDYLREAPARITPAAPDWSCFQHAVETLLAQ